MKKAKKLLVTLLVLTFVMSMFSGVGFAADKDLAPEVVRAIALGVLRGDEKGNLNLDQPITRAEALALVIRISGLEASANLMSGQTKFADVNSDPGLQWATGYINLGVGQGIVNGYPDGTFKGRNQVTYAEIAKLLLYAMNYGVTVEGAPWPAGVMGKADDLGMFDDVNALPNVPATRGDVVKMIDNVLTVSHLKQTGYGDLKQYLEDPDTNFLTKMKVEEIKGVVVTEIAKINSKLDDDEIVVVDKDGKKATYTLIADVTPEEIFGLKIDAWVNDDDEIFFVKVKTNEDDILFDTVKDVTQNEVELKVEDEEFDWAKDAVVYVNFKEVKKTQEVPTGAYGKFVLEKGEVIFACLFDFETVAVVTEVDDDVIEYVTVDATPAEDEIDLEDYDEVYIYTPEFAEAKVEDIDTDSAIFFWENDDDELFIIVKNEIVEGTLERVQASKIKVDGTTYNKATPAIVTLDDRDSFDPWSGISAIEDLLDEEVIVVLDLNGDALLVIGESKATSGAMYGIVTYAKDGRDIELTIFTKDDKEVKYVAESRNNVKALLDLDYYENEFAAIEFKLNSDGEIAKDTPKFTTVSQDVYGGDQSNIFVVSDAHKAADKKVLQTSEGNFYITSDTLIVKALDKDGELDPTILNNDKIISSVIGSTQAIIFGEVGKNAKFIVFTDRNFAGQDDDVFYGVVTSDPWKEGKNYIVEIDVFGEGKNEYTVANADAKEGEVFVWRKGQVVAFTLNNDDKAVFETGKVKRSIEFVEYEDGFVQVTASEIYKVNGGAIIYNLNNEGKLDKKISMSKIANYKYISYVVDDDEIVAAVVSNDPVEEVDDDDVDPSLADINEAANAVAMRKALLALDNEDFNSFTYSDQLNIAKRVLDNRPAEGFADLDEVEEALIEAIEAFYVEAL